MAQLARTRSPDPRWTRELEAAFKTMRLHVELGLASEITEHECFGPRTINACRCPRCRYREDHDAR